MSVLKRVLVTVVAGSFAATSAVAQNNNTGEIEIQGVVPGVWELTVYDLNSGYDFDLSDDATTSARVGTVHVYTNDDEDPNTVGGLGGQLFIESSNAGRMINSASIPGIASDNQKYTLTLAANNISDPSTLVGASALPTNHDLVVPATVDFTSNGGGSTVAEIVYDVTITLDAQRAEGSGVYTDTIIFTIMDDG